MRIENWESILRSYILNYHSSLIIKVQCGPEAVYGLDVAGIFTVVFRELAGVAVERPRLGDLHGKQFDDDVHRAYSREVICEMRSDSKDGKAFVFGISLELDGLVGVEAVAEYHLLRAGVDVERSGFLAYEVELLVVVAAVYAETFEEIRIVFREVQAEDTPS